MWPLSLSLPPFLSFSFFLSCTVPSSSSRFLSQSSSPVWRLSTEAFQGVPWGPEGKITTPDERAGGRAGGRRAGEATPIVSPITHTEYLFHPTFKFTSFTDVAFVFLYIYPRFLLLIYYTHPYFFFVPHPNYLPALIIASRLVLFYRVIPVRCYCFHVADRSVRGSAWAVRWLVAGACSGSGWGGMLSHTPSSLSEPDTPPRHTNSPLSAAEPCWTQCSRRREGPLGVKEGGGWGGRWEGKREEGGGGWGCTLDSCHRRSLTSAHGNKELHLFFFTFICPCAIRSFYLKLFSSSCVCVCTCGRRKWKRERDEVAQWEITDVSGTMFLFSGNLNLLQLLKESCGLVQPAGRDVATVRVSLT